MRLLSAFLLLLLVVAVTGCGPTRSVPPPEPCPIPGLSSVRVTVHKQPDALGYFRMIFEFDEAWQPPRDVLVVLAPFSSKRDREGKYDPARLLEAAEALLGGLAESDRVNVLSYRDLLCGESWFPDEFPFVEHADDLFVRPVMAFDAWKPPAEAVAGLKALRERGLETLRNTSYFIEMLRVAALAFEPGERRVKEIIVLADSHSVLTKGFLSGLPVEVPKINLEPLDPGWTAALFRRLRSESIHVNFVVVAQDKDPAFSGKRLRRMAESTRGFYFDWPDDEVARRRCVEHVATGLYRDLEVDFGASDANYIYTNRWSPGAGEGFIVCGRYNRPGNYTFVIRDTVSGRKWRFNVTLPAESDAHTKIEVTWARQRLLDGVWRLATYGPDDYLTYDLQQLAHRHGLELPEALRPSPFEEKAEPFKLKRPLGKGRAPEVPALDEEAALPPHSALAELAPYDMLYVRYGRLRSALELLDMGYFYGRDVIQALGLHPDLTMIEEKVQTQICVRVSRKLTKIYEAAIAEVAQVSTGAVAAGGNGLDVCLIMRLKMPIAYRLRINQFRKQAIEDYPGTRKRRFRHEGIVVTETLGRHNVVRSYFAMFKHTPRGTTKPRWFAVSGNSWASVRRVLDVHVGKVPSVLANEDFAGFRQKLPLSGFANEATGERFAEKVFVYFGAPAALALTDWRVRALQQEQKLVASHLRLLRNALASYSRDRGVLLDGARWPGTIMGTLVEKGYLPAIPVHPGIGAYAFDPDLQVFYSTRYGRLGWLTPMADLIDRIGEPRYGKPELGATAAQLAWTDDVILSRAITRPDPKDFKFAILRALAGKRTSDFSTFRELMQRPGLAVAMKSRLLQFGGRGLGLSKEKIALNILGNKVKGEIKKAIGWEGDDDPFAWADDEICIVLDADLAVWRTALVDPPLAFGIKIKPGRDGDAAALLAKIESAPGAVKRTVGFEGPEVVTARDWSFALRTDKHHLLKAARDARLLAEHRWEEELLEENAPGLGTALRRFMPERSHVLIRYDSTRPGYVPPISSELVNTALGLFGPAAEEQAQLATARFESLYGNRLAPFRVETVPIMQDAPRPAGSQYCIDPVEKRIASTVYGLPGDFLLSGRVPLDAGIRKALGLKTVGYGAVVLHKDSIEFVGAAPNPGMATWKRERRPGSMIVSREVGRLRTTRSLDRLAKAVCSHDGYLWRLGLRGFELDAERFEKRLGAPPEGTHAEQRVWYARSTRRPKWWVDWNADPVYLTLNFLRVNGSDFTPGVLAYSDFLDLVEGAPAWQRSRLLTGPAAPRYEEGAVERILRYLGEVREHLPELAGVNAPEVMAKLMGWSAIYQGRDVADELRTLLESLDEYRQWWSAGTTDFIREQAREYLRIIEKQ